MGARLVSAAIHPQWSRLTHLQHRVLVVMAQTALDTGSNSRPKAVFWGGWDYIALCIFGTDKPSPAQLANIKRAVTGLIRAGAIERFEVAHGRRRARYRLLLDQLRAPEPPPIEQAIADTSGIPSPDPIGDTSGIPTTDTSGIPYSADRGYQTVQIGDTSGIPGGTIEEPRKIEEETGGDTSRVPAQPQVGTEQPAKKPERCAECGRPERQCRARAARHGDHDYRPVELAPLRLA